MIAIIAILAAVLIPTFASMIKKANVSKDMQLIRNLNTALAADSASKNNEKHPTMTDALAAAEAFGYDVGKINKSATDNEILWDSKNDLFCYFNADKGTVEYIPESVREYDIVNYTPNTYSDDQVNLVDFWVIRNNIDPKYSTYLYEYDPTGNDGANKYIETTKGLDTGNIKGIESITYDREGLSAQTVTIRTESFLTNITIEASSDTVNHYGKSAIIDVLAVAPSSFHEFGEVALLKMTSGRFVAERGSYINSLYCNVNTGVEFEMVPGASIDHAHTTSAALKSALDALSTNVIWDYDADGTVIHPTSTWDPDVEIQDYLADYWNEELSECYPDAVCRNGTTLYNSLKAAVGDMEQSGTIFMLKDHTIDSERVHVQYNTILNLNSHTVQYNGNMFNLKTACTDFTITNGCYIVNNASFGINLDDTVLSFDSVDLVVTSSQIKPIVSINDRKNVEVNCIDTTIDYQTQSTNAPMVRIGNNKAVTDCKVSFTNSIISGGVNWVELGPKEISGSCVTFDKNTLASSPHDMESKITSNGDNNEISITINEDLLTISLSPAITWESQVTTAPSGYVVNGDTVQISTPEGFAWFAKQLKTDSFSGKTVSLTADIDMGAYDWIPAGYTGNGGGNSFRGTFDGGNHKISNIISKSSYVKYTENNNPHWYGNGIFYSIIGGTVRNLIVEDATIGTNTSTNVTGIVAAYTYGSVTFENIIVKDSSIQGYGKVGGIIGMAADPNGTTTVTNCSVQNVSVTGVYNMSYVIGLAQNDVAMSGVTIQGCSYLAVENYQNTRQINVNATVICDGNDSDCIGNGTHIVGTYWLTEKNGNKLQAAFADLYNRYVSTAHECKIDMKNANNDDYYILTNEVPVNAPRTVGGIKYSE